MSIIDILAAMTTLAVAAAGADPSGSGNLDRGGTSPGPSFPVVGLGPGAPRPHGAAARLSLNAPARGRRPLPSRC